MTSRTRLGFAILLLLIGGVPDDWGASPADPDKSAQLANLLQEVRPLIDNKKPQPAIAKCDKIINRFKEYYDDREDKVYCARSSAENVGYLVKAGADIAKGTFASGKKRAITISSIWSDAYFLKAYALVDLNRLVDARSAINLALELSPWSCKYLCELGSIYELEKNWLEAKKAFEMAEDEAPISPDDCKTAELGQARRGLGYVYVELGQLDEAEKKYLQCLAADPKDTRAARELEYVRGLRAKTKPL